MDEKQKSAVMGDPKAGASMDMEALSKLYVQHAQVSFGATEDEWKALVPKIQKVRRLTLQLSSHGKYGRAPGEGPPSLATAWGALAKILANKEAQAAEIKPALRAVIDAEASVSAELKKAVQELKDLLTVRQEAMLVKMGVLQ